LTTKEAVFPLVRVVLQPSEFVIDVIVAAVEPEPVSRVEGIVNDPATDPIDNVAVLPVDVLAPDRSYVTVNVPAPRDIELTVITDGPPIHGEVAVGGVHEARLGAAFTVTA